MLFCIYEVFDAGLSMKMIRYCFGLKQNPGFWFNHTISRLLAHSLRVYFYVRFLLSIGYNDTYIYAYILKMTCFSISPFIG